MELQLESIRKVVGGQVYLYEMSLALKPGLNVLLGPTTAGKTTLMRLMAGLEQPTSGRILLDGQDVTRLPVKKRNVAFVYQQFINYPNLTVFENIASPLRIRGGLSKTALRERVEATARMMRIHDLLDRLPAALSGGQQQRTAIARALVKETGLLLMDEPLVNLDYKLREELRIEMQNIFDSRDAIVVYSTTEPVEALMLGGTVFVLDQGRLLQSGPVLEVYHHPNTQRVGEIFSDPPMNLLDARLEEGQLRLADGQRFPATSHMAGLLPGAYRIGVRPNHVTTAPTGPSSVAVPGVVELAEISGSETFLHTATAPGPDGSPGKLVAQLEGVHRFELGQPTTLYMDPDQLYLFDMEGKLAAAPERIREEAV